MVLGLLTLAVIAQLFRPGLHGSIDTVWAEDGVIFLQGALTQSFGETIFAVYPEYLVVVPRLIAEVASLFPLADAAAIVSVLSATVIAVSGYVVWVAAAGHIRNPYLRGTLALLTVLAPVGGLEAVDSAAYVSWYMLVATFWVLFYRPKATGGAMLLGLFVLATALSNPGVWFFFPIAALRLLVSRDRGSLLIVGSYVVGAAAQVPVALAHPSLVSASWSGEIWTVYLQRVLDGAVLGLRWGGNAWAAVGWPLLIGLLLAAVLGLGYGAWRASPRARWLSGIAIALSLLTFTVSMYQRAAAPVLLWPEGIHVEMGGRYAILPALLLVSAALALIDDSLRRDPAARSFSWAVAVPVTVLLVAIGSSFYLQDLTARGGTQWRDSLKSAAATCRAEGGETVAIRTSPPGFGVTLPCDLVSSDPNPEPTTGRG